MYDLSDNEIDSVSGGESEAVHREISEAIIAAGIISGNPLIFAAGVLYAATN